jgi:Tol biopolymer transport system component
MTEEFTIQCQSCGTFYNDLQEVCPYCGEPQPSPTEERRPPPEEYLAGYHPDEELSQYPEDPLPPETRPSLSDNIPLHEDPYAGETVAEEYLLEDDYFVEDEYPPEENPFVEDDIFAVVGEDDEDGEFDELAEPNQFSELDEFNQVGQVDDFDEELEQYGEFDDAADYSHPDEFDEYGELEHDIPPRRFTWRRLLSGCLVTLVCLGLIYGGVALFAVWEGLQERAVNTQTESLQHYQKGQEYLANNAVELAIAEFERALSLNPNFSAARQALREAQRIAQAQPTPTSETRSVAVANFLTLAETQISERNWTGAVQTLSQVRGLDPDYQSKYISDLLYTAHYQLGLQLVSPEQPEEALAAFEQALAEHPDDAQVLAAQAKILLYLEGIAVEQNDPEKAVEIFDQLYQLDNNYLNVKDHLWRAYESFGDKLVNTREWCRAEANYTAARQLQPSQALQAKAVNIGQRCQDDNVTKPVTATPPATPTPPTVEAISTTPVVTASSAETSTTTTTSGAIFFSTFNPDEARWEIASVSVSGGPPKVIVTEAIMPAVSPDGRLLLYHTELIDAEGLHILDLNTGEDTRLTIYKDHILPQWGGNDQFLFSAQEAGTGRWQVHQGFADGKGDPLILRDGRTPAWSANGSNIVYQGADAEGNNPGIYLAPFGGGESRRLTTHESDRAPAFSPDGSQLAYMSTRNGNWDIYTISSAGSAPRQVTSATGNDGLPTWSPDGTQLAYVSDADGSWAIYIIDALGGTPTKITEWDGSNRADWLLAQIWWAR